jgi:hypothetical protein
MGTTSDPSVEQFVSNRADRLASRGTSLAVVDARGEYFDHIPDAPGRVRTMATDLGYYLKQYEYDRPALATCYLVEHEGVVDLEMENMSLGYCEGYMSTGTGGPRWARWIALDGYVVDVTEEESSGARVEPPTDGTYYGVPIPADRALQMYTEYNKQPLTPHLDDREA